MRQSGSVLSRRRHARLSATAERVQVREIDDDEGDRLLWLVRRGTGSVATWRRA
jgi:hypothetical protein